MKEIKVVEEYIKKIKHELYGIEPQTSKAVLEELESHIQEKVRDLAKKEKLEKPNSKIYKKVIAALGPPGDVVIDYLKILPKKPSIGIKLFLLLQAIIGVISIVIGLDLILYSYDLFIENFYDYITLLLAGTIFLFLGFITLIVILIQAKKPHLIIHYSSLSTLLSLTLGICILFGILGFIIWKHTNIEYSSISLQTRTAPILILLVFAFILGLQQTERFQRRFALEEIDNKTFTVGMKKSKIIMATVALITLALVSLILLSWVDYEYEEDSWGEANGERYVFKTEQLDGKYNATLELSYVFHDGCWYEEYDIKYSIDGNEYDGGFYFDYQPAFDWIKNNTEEDSVILSWWDYGHMIRGYSERDPIIVNPSKSLTDSIADSKSIEYWEDEDKVNAVAQAYITNDSSETIRIMEKYNATYIFTTEKDRTNILYSFFMALELDMGDFFDFSDHNFLWNPTEKGRQTIIYRVWSNENIEGLELTYSDINTRIYKITD